jgi:hypothetical protein
MNKNQAQLIAEKHKLDYYLSPDGRHVSLIDNQNDSLRDDCRKNCVDFQSSTPQKFELVEGIPFTQHYSNVKYRLLDDSIITIQRWLFNKFDAYSFKGDKVLIIKGDLVIFEETRKFEVKSKKQFEI